MPVFTLAAIGIAKLVAAHTGTAAAHYAAAHAASAVATGAMTGATGTHFATLLLVGVVAGSVLAAICEYLQRLVRGGIFTEKQAVAFKEKAKMVDEKTQKEMEVDVAALCAKYDV